MIRARGVSRASTENVCLFCLHRIQSRTNTPARLRQSRPITTTAALSRPFPGSVPARKWGAFRVEKEEEPALPTPAPQPQQRQPAPPPPSPPYNQAPPARFDNRATVTRSNSHDASAPPFRYSSGDPRPSGRPRLSAREAAREAQSNYQNRRESQRPASSGQAQYANGSPRKEGWGRHLRSRESPQTQDAEHYGRGTPSRQETDTRPLIRRTSFTRGDKQDEQLEQRWQARERNGRYVGLGSQDQPSPAGRQQEDARMDVRAERAVPDRRESVQTPRESRQARLGEEVEAPHRGDRAARRDELDDVTDRRRQARRDRGAALEDDVDEERASRRGKKSRDTAYMGEDGGRAQRGTKARSAYEEYDDGQAEQRRSRGKRFDTDALPSSYDATPSRRGRGGGGNDRRAQKFAADPYEEEAEDPELVARRERKRQRQLEKERAAKKAAEVQAIELPPFISVANLATALRVRLPEFVSKLEELGFEEIGNDHVLNFENASLIAQEYNFEALEDRSETEDLKAQPIPEDTSDWPQRPPIVTIMGHVDHGKTTLLDYLRKSSVAATEHGGITQHIGAFSVQMASGKLVTFLDTPGHAAFLSMRQRGANVTDIVILVVAADDSVKPQTIEAIKHAKSARVPIIVAINKIDKDEADIQRVKQDLLRHEIEVEDFGGDVQAIPVSGKTGQGLDELEEAMTALAETLDMRADPAIGTAEGWILEATTKLSGRVATVLVRRGTLRVGDVIVAGSTWARVRTLRNEAGVDIAEAGPGTPVEVDGWRDQPSAGDEVLQAPSEQKATSVVRYRLERLEREQAAKDMEAINASRRLEAEKREREKAEQAAAETAAKSNAPAGEKDVPGAPRNDTAPAVVPPKPDATTDLYFIIKADVSGSAEAIENSLTLLPLANQPVSVHLLRAAVGPISESDIDHVAAVPSGNGIIVSFNQAISPTIAQAAERAGVKIVDENIIYKVIDEVRGLVEDKLPMLVTKRVVGEAEAAAVFEINTGGRKFVKIVGCKVRNGVVRKGGRVRVYRGGVGEEGNVVFDGVIDSLKSQKKDVTEMRKGTECGMGFDKWEDFKVGDVIQCYEEKSEKRRLM